MTDQPPAPKPDRPTLPRDNFRSQRSTIGSITAADTKAVVVTPDYDDAAASGSAKGAGGLPGAGLEPTLKPQRKTDRPKVTRPRNPLEAYGERSSSRPYALRLPEPIDLALRQIAAEERTHPLRIIDRLILEHLARAGRLPPSGIG